MRNQSISLTKTYLKFSGILVAVGLFMWLTSAQLTAAQVKTGMTADQLQALITQLRTQLGILNSTVGTTSAAFSEGMTVELTDNVRVRAATNIDAKIVGIQKAGAMGVISDGPLRVGGYNWVKVDYESGVDGWSVASWLRKKADFAGELPALTTCTYAGKNYKNGEIVKMNISSSTVSVGMKVDKGVATYECLNGRWRLDESENAKIYSFTDTKTITKQYVDPSTATADEEYTLYKIVLKSGRKIEVKIFGRTVPGTTEEAFRKTGFVGNVVYLMNRAKEVPVEVTAKEPASVPPSSLAPAPTPTTVPNAYPPKETPSGCLSGTTTYNVGDKLQTIVVDGKTQVVVDASFVCRAGKWNIEGGLPKPTFTFNLTDVTSVTFKDVNTEPTKKGKSTLVSNSNSVRVYTVTLKSGKVITIRESLKSNNAANDSFIKSGFIGNSGKLKAMATKAPIVKGASTDILSEISGTLITIQDILRGLK